MKKICFIPARLGSTRLPNKPMALLAGIPMIAHCYYRALICNDIDEVYVATCDQEIFDYITGIGGKAVMTSSSHERASDRCGEALMIVEGDRNQTFDLVVMLQGDEPMITPEMISEAIKPFETDADLMVTNLMGEIITDAEFEDRNEIKVVVDRYNNAIYFSREAIPTKSKGIDQFTMNKQVCIIPFRRESLLWFNSAPETPLEKIESIDMLRYLENGKKVRMVRTDTPTFSVDTEDDRCRVEKLMAGNMLVEQTRQWIEVKP